MTESIQTPLAADPGQSQDAQRSAVFILGAGQHRASGSWDDQRVELAKKLWLEGQSCGQIGARLGISRNAVIGKLHRLKLTNAERPRTGKSHVRRPRAKVSRFTRKKPTPLELVLMDGTPLPPREVTDIATVSVVDLDEGTHTRTVHDVDDKGNERSRVVVEPRRHCRWPCIDGAKGITPDQRIYCGVQQVPGLPYCAHHARRAYNPPNLPNPPKPRHPAAKHEFA